MAIDTNKNSYTIIFAVVMVILVGVILSVAAVSLKPFQDENKKLEKMQNILKSIGVDVDREGAKVLFEKHIISQPVLNSNGDVIQGKQSFTVNLAKELKKDISEQSLPLYEAQKDGKKYYIIPLRGNGLWDAIWGYIALKEDKNTVYGMVLDHKGETPGLGAEITQKYFLDRFKNEKIFDEKKILTAITVLKGNNDPTGKDKDDNEIDAISGATITGNGVTAMLIDRLSLYQKYLSSEGGATVNAVKNTEEKQVKVNWTAFKTSDKIAVGGSFSDVKISNINSKIAGIETLEGSKIEVSTISVNSKNAGRDDKIVKFFFNKMLDCDDIVGVIKKITKGEGVVSIKMNGVEKDVNFKYSIYDNIVTIKTTINTLDWNSQTAIKELNKACGDLHKGKDGVSKLWSDVDLSVDINLNK